MAKAGLKDLTKEKASAKLRKNAAELREEAPAGAVKERMTVNLPAALIDQARNAVYWTPGLTVAALVEMALGAQLAKLEKSRGEAFPKRTGAIPTGRPVK